MNVDRYSGEGGGGGIRATKKIANGFVCWQVHLFKTFGVYTAGLAFGLLLAWLVGFIYYFEVAFPPLLTPARCYHRG